MDIREMRDAVHDAKVTIRKADMIVSDMAYLCAGRLRESGASKMTLERLKKELRDFNIHTGCWK